MWKTDAKSLCTMSPTVAEDVRGGLGSVVGGAWRRDESKTRSKHLSLVAKKKRQRDTPILKQIFFPRNKRSPKLLHIKKLYLKPKSQMIDLSLAYEKSGKLPLTEMKSLKDFENLETAVESVSSWPPCCCSEDWTIDR